MREDNLRPKDSPGSPCIRSDERISLAVVRGTFVCVVRVDFYEVSQTVGPHVAMIPVSVLIRVRKKDVEPFTPHEAEL
jgi:hypothetical protein